MQIAKNGLGYTRPNPSVGAVIVHNNTIIAEGFTSAYGDNHAEVNAINAVKNKQLLKQATLYVTLEPCSHYGKTPPCADTIVKHQFKKVVIGCTDTNALVAGKGIARLKKAGIIVVVGVLEKECRLHHKRFFTVQEKHRPFIILKWAETADGFIAPETKNTNTPVWISNNYSQQFVHKLRAKEQAILVGTTTVFADNPKLNVRRWVGQNPVKIVIDKELKITKNLAVYASKTKTIVITAKIADAQNNTIFETIDFTIAIAPQICAVLHKHHIQSLIIEGGAKTLQTFIDANLWDKALVFKGKNTFKNGVKAPLFKGKLLHTKHIQTDTLNTYIND